MLLAVPARPSPLRLARAFRLLAVSALLTIVSELVANSVKHGPGGPIHVNVNVSEDGAVLGRVEDGGRGRVAVREGVNPAEGRLWV